jgi:hypothetical protein
MNVLIVLMAALPVVSFLHGAELDLSGKNAKFQNVSIALLESPAIFRPSLGQGAHITFENSVAFLPELPKPLNSDSDVEPPRFFSLPKLQGQVSRGAWTLSAWGGSVKSEFLGGWNEDGLKFAQNGLGAGAMHTSQLFGGRGLLYIPLSYQYRWGKVQGGLVHRDVESLLEHQASLWQLGMGMADQATGIWGSVDLQGKKSQSRLQLGEDGSLALTSSQQTFSHGAAGVAYQVAVGIRLGTSMDLGVSEIWNPGNYFYPQILLAYNFFSIGREP